MRQALIDRVDTELENVPAEQRDYHPGSSKQVIDLVHPSLYPLQYGHTLVEQPDPDSKDGSSKLVVAEAPKNSWSSFVSSKHAWLPAEFSINDQSKASIDSYINNLHPTLKASLYPVLASVFTRFVPLFERVLDNLLWPPPRRIPVKGDVLARAFDWDDFDVPRYKVPEPGKFSLRNARKADEVTYSLKGRTVQVIVKLANIQLTPEDPEYGGGTWHCEGMINEKIVASGLYYYDQNNIEESRLAFRGAINEGKLWDSKGDEQMLKSSVGVVYGVDE